MRRFRRGTGVLGPLRRREADGQCLEELHGSLRASRRRRATERPEVRRLPVWMVLRE